MVDKQIKVLCVEDDELDRLIIKRAIKACDMNIDLAFAEDMETGKEKTKDTVYDCIFLDCNLPDGSGVELLKYIKGQGNPSPVIVVTSQGDEKIAVEVMKNGAQDYIPKNLLSPEGLSQSLRYVLKMKDNELEKQRIESELKIAQKRLQTVISNSPTIFFLVEMNGTISLYDGKGAKELVIDPREIVGKKISELPAGLPVDQKHFEEAANGNDKTVICELNNKFFEVFYHSRLNENNEATGMIILASDVTNHKMAEKELMNAKQLAEDTARMKEEFLANMSHEIRTPMNGIIGLTGILMNTKMDEEQLGYLKSVRTCSNNLLVIINDILDLAKIDSGKMTFENTPFKIEDMVKHSWELFSTKAAEKNISVKYEMDKNIPASVCGDPTRLSQILNNLVGNAIKFTNQGGVTINAKLRSIRDENLTVDFEVSDTGIGIAEKSIGTIFESFTQASSDTTRKFGGTGLGLTIVKRLIEMQGGSINIRSKVGAGTTFSFHLTFKKADEKENHSSNINKEDYDVSHLNILIAEDNMINQMIVKKLLSDWKAKIEFADNGAIAVEKLMKGNFDLILMDIQMPVMDGYSATKKIRTELPEPFCSTAIMAMTAYATPTERQKSLDCGMNDYISKPFNPMDLKKKIAMMETRNLKPEVESSKPETIQAQTSNIEIPIPTSNPPFMKIDLAYLKEVSGNNAEFITQMIELFLQKTPEALEEMNEKFKQQNWEELKNIAHRIKPSYIYVGLSAINKMLAEIESAAQEDHSNNNVEKVSILIHEVGVRSKEAFKALEQELGQMK